LSREAVSFYENLAENLGLSLDVRLDRCGYLFLATSDEALDGLRLGVELQNTHGIPSRIVSAEESAEIVPGLTSASVVGGAWCEEDGYFDKPQAVVEAFGAAACARGARIEIATVAELERHGNDWHVITDKGVVVAGHVVVAAGVDAASILASHGVQLPVAPEKRHLFLSEPISERLLEPLVVVGERAFAAKQLANGRVLSSDLRASGEPTEQRAVWRETVAAGIEEFLPVLSFVSFPVLATGRYDLTPDHQPVVGALEQLEGLWVAAGYSGHGFMLAPAVSRRLAAAILEGVRTPIPEFAVGRFGEASLEPELQVV
jgi:sarcosine oxidase subunit beta